MAGIMKEASVELLPLEGHSSFFHGKYGIEPCSLRGLVRVTQPFRHPLHLVDTTVTFEGKSASSSEEIVCVDFHSSVLAEGHERKLPYGTHDFEWIVELSTDPLLPPSRKVMSQSGPYHRKTHRIKYHLHAALAYHGMVGRVKKEVSIPMEPFLVWPTAELLIPAPHRWEAVTPSVQYDISVSSTILGPGDAFDFAFRIVSRGYMINNVKLTISEYCDEPQPSSISMSDALHNAGKRKLLSWDWKSVSYDRTEDFFDAQTHSVVFPAGSRPNPTTLPSEAFQTANVHHQMKVSIHFDDAPTLTLKVPVTVLPMPVTDAKKALIDVARNPAAIPSDQATQLTLRRQGGSLKVSPDQSPSANGDTNNPTPTGEFPNTQQPLRKATTIKRRETNATVSALERTSTVRPAQPLPSPPGPPVPDLSAALSSLEKTLIATMQQNQEATMKKLIEVEVEQKRMLRRVFELENLVKSLQEDSNGHGVNAAYDGQFSETGSVRSSKSKIKGFKNFFG
ncbi:uncharacterized protein EV422DRAFT_533830 [Fimicolochytrium jonesii]|uniref:uncharacterized protein n=1 Tax=Fimicolochytrium jonesii TaxID=1396493 RepID=UPI0022FE715B|nr:uncharacterized protein EV422DRAFT_533830 [Fimicolochytrium jonesii]KAI8819661.1 hypothetical protein EV422DRAFT_533830 [Fimicolochytrium jonesii]